MDKRPAVGLGILVFKDNKILLGKRKNAHGNCTWSPPGGHIEFGESFEQCATREVFEETGLSIKNIKFCTATNDIFINDNKHYITIVMIAEYNSGVVQVLEPNKCETWDWFELDKLPTPLFLSFENFIKKMGGFNPPLLINQIKSLIQTSNTLPSE